MGNPHHWPAFAVNQTNHSAPSGWRHLFRLGVRQKVVLILLGTLLITLTASGWQALRAHQQDVVAEAQRHGSELARLIAQNLAFSVVGYDYHTIELLLNALVHNADIVYAKVQNARNNTMAEVGAMAPGNPAQLVFREDIRIGSETVGRLTVGLSTERITRTLEDRRAALIKRDTIAILFIALIEFIALSWFIIRPITAISRALEPAQGKDTPAIPVLSRDEIGGMATEFNRLRDELVRANIGLEQRIELANDQLRRINAELERMTITDPLTGLHNRRYFEKLMEQEVAMASRHADSSQSSIILVDIDGFKQLNDQHGHDVGDGVIREIARILQQRIRRTDALCRIGGDEFFVLCRQTDRQQVMQIAEDLRQSVARQPLVSGGCILPVTISLGAATIGGDRKPATVDELFRLADRALYRSKHEGRNRSTHALDLDGRGGNVSV